MAKSESVQEYHKKITALENKLKNPKLPVDRLPKLQEQLNSIAEKYQDDESVGKERYKIYELQGLIHFYQDNNEEALELLESAQTVYGRPYDYARNLQSQILDDNPQVAFDDTSSIGGIFSNPLGRSDFLKYQLILTFIGLMSLFVMTASQSSGILFIYVISVGIGWALCIRRLYDIGIPRWYVIMLIIPFVNLWLILTMLLAPSKSNTGNISGQRKLRFDIVAMSILIPILIWILVNFVLGAYNGISEQADSIKQSSSVGIDNE